jgi:hypothetical protein
MSRCVSLLRVGAVSMHARNGLLVGVFLSAPLNAVRW